MTSTTSQPTFTLSSGATFPALGFGTYDPDPKKAYEATLHALRAGWRHLDAAHGYKNEREVGRAIREFVAESNGKVTRKDIFLTTKLNNYLHAPADVEWAIKDSLGMLELDYVDLFLIHWPLAHEPNEDRSDDKKGSDGKSILDKALTSDPSPTWRAMEKLHAEGKAKSIGVSNWTIAGLEAMKSYAKTMPAVNQCEVHPLLHNEKLLQYCKSNNIVLAAYSPLGGQMNGAPMFKNEKLQKLAEKKDCTVAQLLISWGLRRGYAVLPKSFTPSRIESNLKLVRLTDEEAEEVGKCSGGEEKRFCDMSDGKIWAESE